MDIRKLDENQTKISNDSLVSVTKMGHIVEVQYMEKRNNKAHIKKLNSDEYVYLETGEIREFEKTVNRSEGINSLRKTFKRLRELINTNFEGLPNELFVTLTYRGELQTRDTERIYDDFRKFMQRLKYRFKGESSIDYINVLEPHETGNFHMHALLRFNDLPSIYIENAELAKIWGNGFVTIQSLKNVDNIGAYVSAYLADIEVEPNLGDLPNLVEKKVNGIKKKFVKGARLIFYPAGVNIYRKSKGIVEPEKKMMKYKNAQKKLGNRVPNFKKGIELIDTESGFKNVIIKEQYNLKRV